MKKLSHEEAVQRLRSHLQALDGLLAKRAAAAGASPREFAAAAAEFIREMAPPGLPTDHPMFDLASRLDAGEFDQDLAALLGYA
jgi:hypothetical protein